MKRLQDILYKSGILQLEGVTDLLISHLSIDSRNVKKGTCFIAIKGTSSDGHTYIADAVCAGAVAIICEEWPKQRDPAVTYVRVDSTAKSAGLIAHQFYGNVSEQLKIVGVTGTNGKTTVATLLFKLFSALGYRCGLISTVQNQIGNNILPSTHTTPDAIRLNELLHDMKTAGCTHVFMECSSHAIVQDRIAGIQFAGAIFTNITHDHLDYHKTFDAYIKAKKTFFDFLSADSFALSNLDDLRGSVMLQNTKAAKYYYSLKTITDFKGKMLANNLEGLEMDIQHYHVHFRLIGAFNAYNLLAVFAAAVLLGEKEGDVLQQLSNLTGAEGRFDTVRSSQRSVLGIVDYAHTPDALKNVLTTIVQLKQKNEQVITVVGCGGDRDKTKRPIMGAVACEWSDQVIFTSDNPRSEDPEVIIEEMSSELSSQARRKMMAIADRKKAIRTAVELASPHDIILIAGKGHEKYQEIKGVKHPFDDKKILTEIFEQQKV
jgi:UDP-N-acetylmuramoyl-L-alanyl-D-glutamate--2,6-diaminopimelate ligase